VVVGLIVVVGGRVVVGMCVVVVGPCVVVLVVVVGGCVVVVGGKVVVGGAVVVVVTGGGVVSGNGYAKDSVLCLVGIGFGRKMMVLPSVCCAMNCCNCPRTWAFNGLSHCCCSLSHIRIPPWEVPRQNPRKVPHQFPPPHFPWRWPRCTTGSLFDPPRFDGRQYG